MKKTASISLFRCITDTFMSKVFVIFLNRFFFLNQTLFRLLRNKSECVFDFVGCNVSVPQLIVMRKSFTLTFAI